MLFLTRAMVCITFEKLLHSIQMLLIIAVRVEFSIQLQSCYEGIPQSAATILYVCYTCFFSLFLLFDESYGSIG